MSDENVTLKTRGFEGDGMFIFQSQKWAKSVTYRPVLCVYADTLPNLPINIAIPYPHVENPDVENPAQVNTK